MVGTSSSSERARWQSESQVGQMRAPLTSGTQALQSPTTQVGHTWSEAWSGWFRQRRQSVPATARSAGPASGTGGGGGGGAALTGRGDGGAADFAGGPMASAAAATSSSSSVSGSRGSGSGTRAASASANMAPQVHFTLSRGLAARSAGMVIVRLQPVQRILNGSSPCGYRRWVGGF
jgi:hypothetical protein